MRDTAAGAALALGLMAVWYFFLYNWTGVFE
jgi:hypothetical protein